jgi:hypothetical protein
VKGVKIRMLRYFGYEIVESFLLFFLLLSFTLLLKMFLFLLFLLLQILLHICDLVLD